MNTPVCLTFQGSSLLICEHKALRASYGKTDQELQISVFCFSSITLETQLWRRNQWREQIVGLARDWLGVPGVVCVEVLMA